MRDQVGIDLDGFPLDDEFSDDYGLEEEDECDIEVEPLFEDELANQAVGPKPKRKSKHMKAYTAAEDKLLCRHLSSSCLRVHLHPICANMFA